MVDGGMLDADRVNEDSVEGEEVADRAKDNSLEGEDPLG